jgi:hypothetical protein
MTARIRLPHCSTVSNRTLVLSKTVTDLPPLHLAGCFAKRRFDAAGEGADDIHAKDRG